LKFFLHPAKITCNTLTLTKGDMDKIAEKIKQAVGDDSFIVGYANLENLLEHAYSKYKYGIVIGKKLDDAIIDSIFNGPNREYFQLYRDTNAELSRLAHEVKNKLLSINITAEVVEPFITEDERNG